MPGNAGISASNLYYRNVVHHQINVKHLKIWTFSPYYLFIITSIQFLAVSVKATTTTTTPFSCLLISMTSNTINLLHPVIFKSNKLPSLLSVEKIKHRQERQTNYDDLLERRL